MQSVWCRLDVAAVLLVEDQFLTCPDEGVLQVNSLLEDQNN